MQRKRDPKSIVTRIRSEVKHALSLRRAIALVLFVVLQVGLEHYIFHGLLGLHDWDLSIVSKVYQGIVTLGFRSTEPNYTVIVRVDSWNRTSGVCSKRDYLERVLARVLAGHPAAVVAAYTIQIGEVCPHRETERLLKTILDGCKAVPIVLGYDLGTGYEIEPHVNISGEQCSTGYTNPEPDYRRLPLQIHGEPGAGRSLSWTAAQLIKPELNRSALIEHSLQDGLPLYSSIFSALDFRDRTMTDAQLFSNQDATPVPITGRVVVIGGFDGDGVLSTGNGPIAGHLVHASYIEAFLDRRIFRAMPEWGHLIVSVVFWLWVDFASLVLLRIGWRGAVLALCCVVTAIGALIIVTTLLIQFCGYYNDFSSVSLIGLTIWFFTSLRSFAHGQ